MLNDASLVSTIVCEITPEDFLDGFNYYEIDAHFEISNSLRAYYSTFESEFILASTSKNQDEIETEATLAIERGYEYYLFESLYHSKCSELVKRLHESNVKAITAYHFDDRATRKEIDKILKVLDGFGGDVLKTAFNAVNNREIVETIEAISYWKDAVDKPVSITPMGTEFGRLASACAGSYMSFAPIKPVKGRIDAKTFKALLENFTAKDSKKLNTK